MAVGRGRYDKPVHFNFKAGFEISSNKRRWDKQDHWIGTLTGWDLGISLRRAEY